MIPLKTRKLKKRPLYKEEVKDVLKKAILSGKLQPGDRIVETQLAKSLGLSQSPVREAIQDLTTAGLIENIPYKGAFVKKITKKELIDSYHVRIGLEHVGIQDAVREITDEKLDELKAVLESMESAAAKQDFDGYIAGNIMFHQLIMEISPNDLLVKFWNQSSVQTWTYIGTGFSEQPLVELAKRHYAIYDALKARDAKKASFEAQRHIEELIDQLNNDHD